MQRIKEHDLVIPALVTIRDNPGITTSELIRHLQYHLKPQGKDNEKIENRNDTYFSQKVRNLKSHDTLSEFTFYDDGKSWFIKPKGEAYLSSNEDKVKAYEDLFIKNFEYNTIIEFLQQNTSSNINAIEEDGFKYFDEDEQIEEGTVQYSNIKIRTRSAKLRKEAIRHFKDSEGKIKCSICGFDFEEKYGNLGNGFIEIHHKKPIYTYLDQDYKQLVSKILNNLIPVCSNCHRMIHRMDKVDEERLKKIITTINL